eukprot:4278916-Prymnesium_polylepis.1
MSLEYPTSPRRLAAPLRPSASRVPAQPRAARGPARAAHPLLMAHVHHLSRSRRIVRTGCVGSAGAVSARAVGSTNG